MSKRGRLQVVLTSTMLRPASEFTDSSFGFERWTGANGACHYGVTFKTNGVLAVLRPAPDASGNCSGDPAFQAYQQVTNWEAIRAGGVVHVTLSWDANEVRVDVSDGGANAGAATYSGPANPAEADVALPLRLYAHTFNDPSAPNFGVKEIFDLDDLTFLRLPRFGRLFEERFEIELMDWLLFEEPVPCSAPNLANTVLRSTERFLAGAYSGRVWANFAARPGTSNHVNWYNNVSRLGQTGVWRYIVYALIDPAGSGQTGPEFSTQNTRRVAPGQFRTHTAGIQYVSNPFLAVGGQQPFNIWVEVSPGLASWQDFSPPLRLTQATATWMKFTLDVNYDVNEYVAFSMRSADGSVNITRSLSGVRMAEEAKGFTNEAFVITTEAQNLYDCDSTTVHQNKVFYDALSLGVVSSLSFTDDPIVPAATTAMAVHVSELRSRIDTARQRCGTSSYSWDATLIPAVTPVRASHVIEMRTALNEAYASCGRTAPTYTDALVAGSTPIRAVHLAELRNAVAYLE